MALLRLHTYTGEERYLHEAEGAIKLFAAFMMRQPMGFAHLLEAVDFYHRGAKEIVLVGDRDPPNSRSGASESACFTSPTGPASPSIRRRAWPGSFRTPPGTKLRSMDG